MTHSRGMGFRAQLQTSNGLERPVDLTQWLKAGSIGLFTDRINKPPMASNGRMACWLHIVAQTVAIEE